MMLKVNKKLFVVEWKVESAFPDNKFQFFELKTIIFNQITLGMISLHVMEFVDRDRCSEGQSKYDNWIF